MAKIEEGVGVGTGVPSRGIRLGFTLVELLVTIAVIAILMTLLFPALKTASELGRETSCRGNLRQIGVVLFSYTSDFNDYMPLSANVYNSSSAWSSFVSLSYVTSTKIYDCPSDKTRTPSSTVWPGNGHYYNYWWHKGNNQGYFWWYTYGLHLSGWEGTSSRKISLLKKTHFDLVATDGETHDNDTKFYYATSSPITSSTVAHWDRHHTKGANFVFVDGSTKIISYVEYMNNYFCKGDYP